MNATRTTNLESIIFYGLIFAAVIVATAILVGCVMIAWAVRKRNQ